MRLKQKERILGRIKLAVQEPKTTTEIMKEINLGYNTTRRTLEKMVNHGDIFKVCINPNRHATMTPIVWCLKTDDPETDNKNKIKALFKSASKKYGIDIFEYLYSSPVSTRSKIADAIGVKPQSIDSQLKTLKKYGLVDNEPSLYWYSLKLVDNETLKRVNKLYEMVNYETFEKFIGLEDGLIELEKIVEKIKLAVKEPKTVDEVVGETGLSRKTAYTNLKNLEEERSVFSVNVSSKKYSGTPTFWCLKTGDAKTDKLNRLKASFKSASPKHGATIFEHLYDNIVSTRRKMVNDIGIDVTHLDTVLQTLRKHGLVDREPLLYWYNAKIIGKETLEKINILHKTLDDETFEKVIGLYSTVRNGVGGFQIDYNGSMFIARPRTRKISRIGLQTIATLNDIVVQDGNNYLLPIKGAGEPSGWSWYKELSTLVKELLK